MKPELQTNQNWITKYNLEEKGHSVEYVFKLRVQKIIEKITLTNPNFNFKDVVIQVYKNDNLDEYYLGLTLQIIDIYTKTYNNGVFTEGTYFNKDVSLVEFLTILRKLFVMFIVHELDESIFFNDYLIFNQHGWPYKEKEVVKLYSSISRENSILSEKRYKGFSKNCNYFSKYEVYNCPPDGDLIYQSISGMKKKDFNAMLSALD